MKRIYVSTNGFLDRMFTVYADANTKPFFRYQLSDGFKAESIEITSGKEKQNLIAFYDCSNISHCGERYIDELYGENIRYAWLSLIFK